MALFWRTLFTLPFLFTQIVGVTVVQFEELYVQIEKQFPSKRHRKLCKKGKLLMCLIYMCQYVSHAFLVWIFGVSKSTIEDMLSKLEIITAP